MSNSASAARQVTLSHNQADKPRVQRLAECLRAANLRVWFDEWVIKAGDGPSPVGRERVAEGRVREKGLAIEHGLEASRTLVLWVSPADSLELRTLEFALPSGLERSTVGRGNCGSRNLRFRDPANAGCRFIPLHPSEPHSVNPEENH